MNSDDDDDVIVIDDMNINNNDNLEYITIDQKVLTALDRIQIIRPTDVANGYVATLECLHQTIQKMHHGSGEEGEVKETDVDDGENIPQSSTSPSSSPHPPILLLMDSAISAFDATDKMYESICQGLSGRNEFVRQLKRLQLSHDIILVATRTIRGNTTHTTNGSNSTSSNKGSSYHPSPQPPPSSSFHATNLSNCDGWNKMVTSRITLRKVLVGSKEEENGYGFVALMPPQRFGGGGNGANSSMEWNSVIPFSITDDGIKC